MSMGPDRRPLSNAKVKRAQRRLRAMCPDRPHHLPVDGVYQDGAAELCSSCQHALVPTKGAA